MRKHFGALLGYMSKVSLGIYQQRLLSRGDQRLVNATVRADAPAEAAAAANISSHNMR